MSEEQQIVSTEINPRDLNAGLYWARLRRVRNDRDAVAFCPIERGEPVLVRLIGLRPCLRMKFVEHPEKNISSDIWQERLVWMQKIDDPGDEFRKKEYEEYISKKGG